MRQRWIAAGTVVMAVAVHTPALSAQAAATPAVPTIPRGVSSTAMPLPTALPAAGTPLTLGQALAVARQNNPILIGGRQHVDAVRANEITAALRQNPFLVAETTQTNLPADDPGGPAFYGAGVQRLFERGGKRDLRITAARGNTAVAFSQSGDQQRLVEFNVRSAFTRMIVAKLALAISAQNLADYRRTVELQKVRLDAGDVDRTDFDRVELQLVNFEQDETNATLTLTQASQQLQTLLGYARPSDSFDITGTLDLPALPQTLAELETAAVASRPDLRAAEQQVQANEAATRLAIANGKADPTLGGEYEHSGRANTFGANLNLPIRLFDRNQGEKERTRLEAQSSRSLLQAQRNQVVSDVDQAYAAYQAASTQAKRYQDKYLAEAAHVRDNLQFSYRNGNSTLLDYLSALSDYRQINLAAIQSQAQALLALHQLSYATATEVNP